MKLKAHWLVLVVTICVTVPSLAMNLRHYDVTSLVYLSTDIVIADLSEDTNHNFVATVSESLYESIRQGEQIERLQPFLTFFEPMKGGMQVILFLDRRPHAYDFLNKEAANSPFAIPPSGVYLIDEYEHVHQYFQRRNPGPYVAQGYEHSWQLKEPGIPTKADDLALPSLKEVKGHIASAIECVGPLRGRLDKTATRDDVPFLMGLLGKIPRGRLHWNEVEGSAIFDRAIEQIRSLQDVELMNKAEGLRAKALERD